MEMITILLSLIIAVILPAAIINNTIEVEEENMKVYISKKIVTFETLDKMRNREACQELKAKKLAKMPSALAEILANELELRSLERRESEFQRSVLESERFDRLEAERELRDLAFKAQLRAERETKVSEAVSQIMAYAGDIEMALIKKEPEWSTPEFHLSI